MMGGGEGGNEKAKIKIEKGKQKEKKIVRQKKFVQKIFVQVEKVPPPPHHFSNGPPLSTRDNFHREVL